MGIKIAIEKSIQEWATPVIERANKIALTTTEPIIKKDFALDPDESRMRAAAHNMVRNLTSGMAMITSRDHLQLSIKNHLKNFMVTSERNLTQQQTDEIEMTVAVIANDNVELACSFIQKKAIEKAIQEIDKLLKNEYEQHIVARKEGRRYYDPVVLIYQTEQMPEPIKLKLGGVTNQQSAVYSKFACNIPGFKPLTDRELHSILPGSTPQIGRGDTSGSGPQTLMFAPGPAGQAAVQQLHGGPDPLAGLPGQLRDSLNLGTVPVSSASSAFSALPGNLAGNFHNLSPGSPNRLFGPPGAPVAHTRWWN